MLLKIHKQVTRLLFSSTSGLVYKEDTLALQFNKRILNIVWCRLQLSSDFVLYHDWNSFRDQLGPVVRKVDNAIHWINLYIYPVDKGFGFPKTYPFDSDLSIE